MTNATALETTERGRGKAGYFRDMERLDRASGPAWLNTLRDRGAALFMETSLPHTKMEEWRQTNIAPLVEAAHSSVVAGDGQAAVSPEAAGAHLLGGCAAELVFVDGLFRAELSVTGPLPPGVTVSSLHGACRDDAAKTVQTHLGSCLRARSAFTAINTAFLDDGAFLHAARGVELAEPVHFVFLSARTASGQAAHPRVLIVLEENARASVVMTHAALPGAEAYFNNVVEEVVLGDGAALVRQEVVSEGATGRRLGTTEARLGRDSRLESHTATLSGELVRSQIQVHLAGPGAEVHLNGLYLNNGKNLVNHDLGVLHDADHCTSRIAYKGVLEGESRSVFTGKVHVLPHAQQTDSMQLNNNLLLSDTARVDTKPQLEIYADDVKCTHGSTVGPPPEDIIFYFRSRGVCEKTARGMLTYGFAGEIVGRIPDGAPRRRVDRVVFNRFRPEE